MEHLSINSTEKTTNESNYNLSLHISTSDDLLTVDPVTQALIYDPCSEQHFIEFSALAEHFKNNLCHLAEEIKFILSRHITNQPLHLLYDNLMLISSHFILNIRRMHKCMYVSIYHSWVDEFMALYQAELKPALEMFALLHDDSDPNTLNRLHRQLLAVDNAMNDLYVMSSFRTPDEMSVILNYIHDQYTLNNASSDDALYAGLKQDYLSFRSLLGNANDLRALYDNTEFDTKQTKLGRIWISHRSYPDSMLASALCLANGNQADYDELFRMQDFCSKVSHDLKNRVDFEEQGDPIFSHWVDPDLLKQHLWAWVKANITSQQLWFTMWCLMKYTFSMIRVQVTKQEFADRMNRMFPDASKHCVYASFYRLENQNNHNKHFSQWLESDPYYLISLSLNKKLEAKKQFSRV